MYHPSWLTKKNSDEIINNENIDMRNRFCTPLQYESQLNTLPSGPSNHRSYCVPNPLFRCKGKE